MKDNEREQISRAVKRAQSKRKPVRNQGISFLYEKYNSKVFSLCFGMAKSEELASDIAQDVWVRIIENIKSFRGDAAFSTWLYRIAFNMAATRLKELSAKRTKFGLDSIDSMRQEEIDSVSSDSGRAADSISNTIVFKEALSSIPEHYQAVVVMHDVMGMTHKEIASEMGYTEGNSKSLLFNARKKISEYMKNAN